MNSKQCFNFWIGILGFKPENVYESNRAESKCYNCESENIEKFNASSWTSKYKCKDCGYYSFIVYADAMGGNNMSSIATDKKDFKL